MSCGHGTLTCVVCGESSTGEMILETVKQDEHEVWETIYTRVDHKRYWICSELICNPCLFGIMRNIDVEFPGCKYDESSSSESLNYEHDPN